jgi:hypothetical protein
MVCAGGGARQADKRSVRHLNSSASGSVRVSALLYWAVVVVSVVLALPVPVGASGGGLSLASWGGGADGWPVSSCRSRPSIPCSPQYDDHRNPTRSAE